MLTFDVMQSYNKLKYCHKMLSCITRKFRSAVAVGLILTTQSASAGEGLNYVGLSIGQTNSTFTQGGQNLLVFLTIRAAILHFVCVYFQMEVLNKFEYFQLSELCAIIPA
ncbi:MAG: hypothetical protein BA874_04405 [Desulfuromonadales bacterium C00003068]|nr:MAG: hypothetical protein BA874_04405 [Desulfuromonadales bacterium C00003068]